MTNIAKHPVAGIRTLVARSSPRTEMERWFIKRGLPHFIEPYSAGPDVWSRAAPVLALAYIGGGLHGLDLAHWTLRRNLIGAGVVLAILLATWMVTNLARRRPPLSRPRELGGLELAAFLIGPALPSMVFTQWGDAVQALIEGAVVLTVIYFTTSYGIVPLVGWATRQTFSRLGSVGRVLSRAMPLLLLFTTFLFINAEVWQVAGVLEGPAYALALGLFFLLGSAFVLSRVPEAIRTVHQFDDWKEVVNAAAVDYFRTPDNVNWYEVSEWAYRIVNRHAGTANCCFLDGHVKPMRAGDIGFQYPLRDPRALWDIY